VTFLSTIGTIFRKELLDTLRDKRTVVAMIVLPILLYPGLFLIGSQVLIIQQEKVERTVSKVAIMSRSEEILADWLSRISMVERKGSDDPRPDLLRGFVDAVLVVPENISNALDKDETIDIIVEYDATEPASREAMSRLIEGLAGVREDLLNERLEEAGLPAEFAAPLRVESANMAPPAKTTGTLLGIVLPVLMVIMLGVGAFYPAIDLTAGEKERGTFETLFATPVRKFDLVTGKFLTVLCLSLTTGLLNLGSMALTFGLQFAQLAPEIGPIDLDLKATTVALIILLLIPLAFFISAMMMLVAVMARSFREAQNLVTPFFLLLLLPAGLAAFPDVELSVVTQFIPVTNISLLFKKLMTGRGAVEEIFAVLISSTVYAMLALLAAAWVFQREEVILAEEAGVPLTLRRSQFTPRSEPTPGIGLFVQAQDIFSGMLITQWALFFFPTLFLLWFLRVRIRSALSLHMPALGSVAGASLVAAGWMLCMLLLNTWLEHVFPMPRELAEEMARLYRIDFVPGGLASLVFMLAVSPAICEEMLFRGVLLSSIRNRLPAWATVIVIGLLFGFSHLNVYRVLVTGLTGGMLAYLVLRSNSLYVSMLAHLLYNGFAVFAATEYLPEPLMDFLEHIEKEGLSALQIAGLLALALVLVGVGVLMVEQVVRRDRERA